MEKPEEWEARAKVNGNVIAKSYMLCYCEARKRVQNPFKNNITLNAFCDGKVDRSVDVPTLQNDIKIWGNI